jgi:hypothetical protein
VAHRLGATTTYPIHTEHPDQLHPKGTTVVSPELNVPYPVGVR